MAQPPSAGANVRAALILLQSLRQAGLTLVVVCPGSRSGPLAVAAALLEPWGLRLTTALDERSAAFFALGHGRGAGGPAAVITTSGSAVAHLLPAAVEADYGTIPLLLLCADRPQRLKDCGANQCVNQERFLLASCRWVGQAKDSGLGSMEESAIERLARRAMAEARGQRGQPPGAVHLNLPLDEPLHASSAEISALAEGLGPGLIRTADGTFSDAQTDAGSSQCGSDAGAAPAPALNPDRPGLILAGPWRGSLTERAGQIAALAAWQRRSGWPLLADALSGLRGCPELEVIAGYDLILRDPPAALAPDPVLRHGPLPTSRSLQDWLQQLDATQVLISEGDPRPLDPLRRCAWQWSGGFSAWLAYQPEADGRGPAPRSLVLAQAWRRADAGVQRVLNEQLPAQPTECEGATPLSEPWLARQLARLLPPRLPLMLANISPVRDWESFSPGDAPPRPLFSYRGASGIDGTLSIACGLAEALGELVLICGDLALLHDRAGWLWGQQLSGRLSVVLIDNGGGGIFEQLPIRAGSAFDFDRLFSMPQPLDPLRLAELHGVPCARLRNPQSLPQQLLQLLQRPNQQRLGLLAVTTDSRADAKLRQRLRRQSSDMNQGPEDPAIPFSTMTSEPPVQRPPRP
ncbi:MAG: 2-succinyl-5-enolpyruvyl-6-hydroxy-3-cyclohexene-1-carboxylic-acid synthase [Synechococcaceae cyanobacterium]